MIAKMRQDEVGARRKKVAEKKLQNNRRGSKERAKHEKELNRKLTKYEENFASIRDSPI